MFNTESVHDRVFSATQTQQSPDPSTSNSPSPNTPASATTPSSVPSPETTAAIKPPNNPTAKQGVPDVSKPMAIAKQDPGKTYLSNLLLLQQTEKLVKGRFSSDLKGLAADVPTETDDYRIEMRTVDSSKAVMVAIAKQPGISSYTGAVYAIEAKIPVVGLCKTNVPSLTPPQAPQLVHEVVMCPQGASAAN
jgi:hypothetical protein